MAGLKCRTEWHSVLPRQRQVHAERAYPSAGFGAARHNGVPLRFTARYSFQTTTPAGCTWALPMSALLETGIVYGLSE
jgi:hypothetical protein